MENKKKKITLFSLGKFNVDDKNILPLGGAENQIMMLAKSLSKYKYYDISFFVLGAKSFKKKCDHIKYKVLPSNDSVIYNSIYIFYNLLKTKSNVIITRAASPSLFVLGVISKLMRAKLILFMAHDWELVYGKKIKGWRWRLFLIGIRFCNKICVQNKYQSNNLSRLNLIDESNIILSKNLPLLKPNHNKKEPLDYFLWIGTYRKHKRPEYFIELAKQLPQYNFLLVINFLGNKNKEKQIKSVAVKLNNLNIICAADRNKILEIYKNAKALIITSEGEGFPNVAIEAWSQGKVVISSPNNSLYEMKENKGCLIYNNFDELKQYIGKDDGFFIKAGLYGHKYFLSNFEKKVIIKEIISIL